MRAFARLAPLALLVLAACTSEPPGRQVVALPPSDLPATAWADADLRLAIGDQVGVVFPYRKGLDLDVPVRTDGKIALPFVGEVSAAGRTPAELQTQLRSLYASIAYDPTQSADAREQRHYLIQVDDLLELKFRSAAELNDTVRVRPDGRISLSLVDSLLAEGQTPEALQATLIEAYGKSLKDPQLVVIVREASSAATFADGRLSRAGVRDVDEVEVSLRAAAPRQIFVAGEVAKPGFVAYQPPLTALQAIVTAGGEKETGELRRVIVLRRWGPEQPTATFVNLGTDVEGQTINDVSLRPWDVVIVPRTSIASIHKAMDDYFYQLVPAMRNLNFSFIYDINGDNNFQ